MTEPIFMGEWHDHKLNRTKRMMVVTMSGTPHFIVIVRNGNIFSNEKSRFFNNLEDAYRFCLEK